MPKRIKIKPTEDKKTRFEEILARETRKAEAIASMDKLTYAMSLGLRTEQIVCPLCCRNRVLDYKSSRSAEKGKTGRVSFSNADFEGRNFLMVTYAIPRQGFHVNQRESKNFIELVRSGEYDSIVEEIYEQCGKIRRIIEENRR